ncbi:hypothetical protein SUGI_1198360 [Cryptomeria japonica]|uniref:cytokinin dehydrogenase 7 n=1 Tax=Cryptomeria japonica TaxID=3369 RepID=UPI00241487A0|nr:cytokinin dehydrogenase 7 [Cryptomeria japonica]GLJ55818.1 hypothetical protein SUGI_1198360 [Cryptomeria japonica]
MGCLVTRLLVLVIAFMDRIITNGKLSDYIPWSSALCKEDSDSLSGLGPKMNETVSMSETKRAARDFGGVYNQKPASVVYSESLDDIVRVVRKAASSDHLTVAARGNGHSTYGQAQALNGIVLDMSAMKGIAIQEEGVFPYVDVEAGALWIDVLRAALKVGLSPRSWTDYLFLSIGGTLSNAGISGQTFRFGPQISNVAQLEVVTGKGEVMTCSPQRHEELFYGVLGGLGQFGIISKARIVLQRAPDKTRWMRLVYSDFEDFRRDQELIISSPEHTTFDYMEGFAVVNSNDHVNGWPSIPLSPDVTFDSTLIPATAGPLLYFIEVAIYYNATQSMASLNKQTERKLASLNFIKGLSFSTDVTYVEFLNRVYREEIAARASGAWDAPHPWLNLFVPKSKIVEFNDKVLKEVLAYGIGGPLLVYPLLKNKWDSRMSTVVPDEDVFYLVGLLRSSRHGGPSVERLLEENDHILRICETSGMDIKQYLPHYKMDGEWRKHFGTTGWDRFKRRKERYDPLAILAPGQRIFSRS